MPNIYEFDDYKVFVRAWIEQMPRKGRGQYRKMAMHLRVSSVAISQIFKADRHLAEDQAYSLSIYFGWKRLETRYFVLLVQKARAGTADYSGFLQTQLSEVRAQAQELKNRLGQEKILDEQQRATFYSDWSYSAVRLASQIQEMQSPSDLAKLLNLPVEKIESILGFLVESRLCLQDNGRFKMGPRSTHLESGSPLIKTRQVQWRIKGFERMEQPDGDELFFYSPNGHLSRRRRDRAIRNPTIDR